MKTSSHQFNTGNASTLNFVDAQLVYLDPPFFTNRNFGEFDDRWDSWQQYYTFLKKIISHCHSRIKSTGFFVLHCDNSVQHKLQILLDDIFGESNHLNTVVVKTTGNKKTLKRMSRSYDVLFFFCKNKNQARFNPIYLPYDDEYRRKNSVKKDESGREYITSAAHNSQPNVIVRPNLRYEWNGHHKQWWVSQARMQEFHDQNRLVYNARGIPRIKRFLEEMPGIPVRDLWTDISSTQGRVKYPTQKSIKLLERIITLTTSKGDLVVDPMCGSGTTGVACQNLERLCVLNDINPAAIKIAKDRLKSLDTHITIDHNQDTT